MSELAEPAGTPQHGAVAAETSTATYQSPVGQQPGRGGSGPTPAAATEMTAPTVGNIEICQLSPDQRRFIRKRSSLVGWALTAIFGPLFLIIVQVVVWHHLFGAIFELLAWPFLTVFIFGYGVFQKVESWRDLRRRAGVRFTGNGASLRAWFSHSLASTFYYIKLPPWQDHPDRVPAHPQGVELSLADVGVRTAEQFDQLRRAVDAADPTVRNAHEQVWQLPGPVVVEFAPHTKLLLRLGTVDGTTLFDCGRR